jgi:hypothetical protein
MRRPVKGRRLDDPAERVLFGLVTSRALPPLSRAGRGPLDHRGRATVLRVIFGGEWAGNRERYLAPRQ